MLQYNIYPYTYIILNTREQTSEKYYKIEKDTMRLVRK